ncbi:MAG: hypothetical protein ACI376_05650 [Candidatus Bruticola sp.]
MGSFGIALPLGWLFLLILGGLFHWVNYSLNFNWNFYFCWLVAIFVTVHFLQLAPCLAASVKKDRDMGILQTLRLTPGGPFKAQLFKILVCTAPYILGWLVISVSTSLLCLFSPSFDGEIAGLGLILSFLSIVSAAFGGVFWGSFYNMSSDSCASSLRKLILFLIVASYGAIRFGHISQLESFLIISSLVFVLWHKSINFFQRDLSWAVALLCICLSYLPAVRCSSLPLLYSVNPVCLSLGPLYSMDSLAMTGNNQASRWAYPVLQSQFNSDESTSLNDLLEIYSSSSEIVRRQINNRIKEEAELSMFGGFLSCIFSAFFLGMVAFINLYCSLDFEAEN